MSDPVAVPHCYRHPAREAHVRCVRCDRPICPECMRPASVGFHCPDDVDAARKTMRVPRNTLGAVAGLARPTVTYVLIALNVVVYLVTALAPRGQLNNPTNSRLFLDWQLSPFAIHTDGDYYQLITSTFLHLDVLHIVVNMISLAIIGPAVELALGHWRFLATYLLCGVGGSVAVFAFGSEFGFTAGASGAIFGLFGIALLLHRRIGLQLQWLIATIVLNFVLTFSVANISELAHVGGFVAGLLCGVSLGGKPTSTHRIPTRIQAIGLGGVLVLLVVIAAVRGATF